MDTYYKEQASAFLDLWEELIIQSVKSPLLLTAYLRALAGDDAQDIQPIPPFKNLKSDVLKKI